MFVASCAAIVFTIVGFTGFIFAALVFTAFPCASVHAVFGEAGGGGQ